VGRTFETQGQSFTVIGVVRNVSRVRESAYADIWAPLTTLPTDTWKTALMGDCNAMFLADSPRSFRAIRAEFAARLPHVVMTEPDRYKTMSGSPRTRLDDVAAGAVGTADDTPRTGIFIGVLVLLSLLFMMLPAINLVNLNISRIFERVSEIGVRKAFGASTGHLVGQFIVENTVLALVGGAIGLALSLWALQLINGSGLVANADFRMNPRIFLYGFGLSLFFGVFSGAYPAWRMARLDPSRPCEEVNDDRALSQAGLEPEASERPDPGGDPDQLPGPVRRLRHRRLLRQQLAPPARLRLSQRVDTRCRCSTDGVG
jgi:putative ABC transport system permease protein